ncbi:MAG: class I SAM-dependent methyltransferase [Planctomycetaceae bacterium]|jgi:ubiquinone/menaquinone biosynthesis C-methylase UbiE|nr:class I SAM-dependent methyltransferase [Planctomycetaceae bacterium]
MINIDQKQFPRSSVFIGELESLNDRFIVAQIKTMLNNFGDEYVTFLEKVLFLANTSKVSPVDSILDYTTVFLREQVRFQQTDSYSHESFDEVYDEVYNNPDVMEGFYLDGLLLTQACWEIHYHIHRFFCNHFLPRCKGKAQGLEIGFGHGLYLYEILQQCQNKGWARCVIYGLDISEYSLKYATRLLKQSFSEDLFILKIGDIQNELNFPEQSMEFGLMAEVIEHIHSPDQALLRMRHCLKSDSPLYVVTPMNSNAVDHITNFQSIDEIEKLIISTGFVLETKEVFSVKQFQPESKDRTETLCAVFRAL